VGGAFASEVREQLVQQREQAVERARAVEEVRDCAEPVVDATHDQVADRDELARLAVNRVTVGAPVWATPLTVPATVCVIEPALCVTAVGA
jgi:hypothetical protein